MIAGWSAVCPDMMFRCRKQAFKLLPCPCAACAAGLEQRDVQEFQLFFAEALALWVKDCGLTPLMLSLSACFECYLGKVSHVFLFSTCLISLRLFSHTSHANLSSVN